MVSMHRLLTHTCTTAQALVGEPALQGVPSGATVPKLRVYSAAWVGVENANPKHANAAITDLYMISPKCVLQPIQMLNRFSLQENPQRQVKLPELLPELLQELLQERVQVKPLLLLAVDSSMVVLLEGC